MSNYACGYQLGQAFATIETMIDDFKPKRRFTEPRSVVRPGDALLEHLPVEPEPKEAPNLEEEDETFQPPEVVAETTDEPTPVDKTESNMPETSLKKKRRSPIAWFKGLKLWQRILVIAAILILLGSGAAGAYYAFFQQEATPAPVVKTEPAPEPEPTTVPNTLTGREVDKAVNELPVTGVMIENSMDARPQSGLYDAGVVFEAIAEGGITRFLALYQDTEPESIGPVRSARPYYVQWAAGFDAAYAHVGGSPEALQNIREWGIKDMDQGNNAAYFTRVTSRYAPHNVYTSMAKLRELETQKGFTTSNFTGFARKAEKPAAEATARTIDVNISSALYRSSYTYDAESNSYLRNLAGQPHIDEAAGKQINPKVVVGLVMDYSIAANRIHSVYGVIGSGQAYIFQDGTVTVGTWTKDSRQSQISFLDASGKTIGLNPGQTWLTAVSDAGKITYGP